MTATRAARIERELIHELYAHGLRASLITLVISSLIVGAMWTLLPHTLLWIWYALVVVNQVVRLVLVRAFNLKNPDGDDLRRWARHYTVGTIIGGTLYGSVALLMFPYLNAVWQAFLTILLSGMASGSITTNAYHPPAMNAYLITALLPMSMQFALSGTLEHGLLAFTTGFYLVMMLSFGRSEAQLIRRSIEFGHENLDLIEALKIKTKLAEDAQQKAEQASLAKSKFFTAASHDLRQPLQALELFASSMKKSQYAPDEAHKLDQMLLSVGALSSLFDELLDISKLDAGYVQPALVHFSAVALFARLNVIFSPLAQERKIKLRFFNTNATLYTDPVLLERILGNLISNAIRNTAVGGVLVGCRRRGTALCLEVWDTGIGIPADKFEPIFDEFYQIANPERDRRHGLGLGLATVRRLAALLNCRISLDSRLNQGSVFRVEVAAGDATQVVSAGAIVEETAPDVNILRERVILIIDDEGAVRAGLTEVLETWGCRVVATSSTADALAALSRQGLMPEAMIADYRLREHDNGINAIAAVRKKFDVNLPALLISGDTAVELFKAAQENNLPLLQKPVRAAKLRATLAHFFSR